MGRFFLGTAAGALSGLLTYALSADVHLAALAAGIIAVLAWCGILGLLVLDN